MAFNFKVNTKSGKTFLRFKRVEKDYPGATFRSVQRATLFAEGEIVKNLTTGKFGVKTRSNRLRGSISHKFIVRGSRIGAKIGSDVIYARIQEQGGKINVSTRMSKYAWAKFKETGLIMWKAIALKKGQQITIPPHWYMRNTLLENQFKIRDFLADDLGRKAFK